MGGFESTKNLLTHIHGSKWPLKMFLIFVIYGNFEIISYQFLLIKRPHKVKDATFYQFMYCIVLRFLDFQKNSCEDQ